MIPVVLAEVDWTRRESDHTARVAPWIEPHLARSSRGESHPVYDFLFEYYGYRPSLLRRWQPGLGVALAGNSAEKFLSRTGYARLTGGIGLDPGAIPDKRRATAAWIRDLLTAITNRPPAFGCSGLHEWAMVFQNPERRHPTLPLRLGTQATDAVTASLPIRCTHFDAFRFFTDAARPLNRFEPTRPTVPVHEQSGCLHTNMDLYKWAAKLSPFLPSELTADCFALARSIREVDMRASPYDLSAFGFAPIPIETPVGRAEYETYQRHFANEAALLRQRLINVCDAVIASGPIGREV